MTIQEAKFILKARHPDGRDDTDPRFAEALAMAKADPALEEWTHRERAFDLVVGAQLREVQPPAGLRDAILAGACMSRPVPLWRRRATWFALAACLTLFLGLSAAWPALRPAQAVDRLALGVLDEVNSTVHHETMPQARGKLDQLLRDPATRLAAGLPLDFAQFKADGCRSLTIAGREVLEVCFERGGDFHLYVARRRDFGGDKSEHAPMFRERGTLASVAWTDERHTYVLVTGDGAPALRSVF